MAVLAQSLNTNDEGGENEGSSLSPLKEFLSKELGTNSDAIHTKLRSLGIINTDTLLFSDEPDLNELCQALELSFGVKMQFKAGVRKLKQKAQSKQQPEMVTITCTEFEQDIIDKLNLGLTRSTDIQQLFQRHSSTLEEHVSTIKTQFITQMDEWKSGQLENIRKETERIMQYHDALKVGKTAIDNLLRNSAINHRDLKIKEIVNRLFRDDGIYNKYQDISLLKAFILNNTKLIDIKWDENVNSVIYIPSIALNLHPELDCIHNANDYKMKLNWIYSSNEEEKTSDFTVKYTVKYESQGWKVLNTLDIKQENGNKYSVNIDNYFAVDKEYSFMVEKMIKTPLTLLIQSNVASYTKYWNTEPPGAMEEVD
eukprot:266354_1